MVIKIINILKGNKLSENDFKTTYFNTYPNRTVVNGQSTIVGYVASQSFEITIPNIKPDGSNIGKIFDELAQINGIVLNGLGFDIFNKTKVFSEARALAFENAQNKAFDYSTALSLTLGSVVNIKDTFSSAPVVSDGNKNQEIVADAPAISVPT